MSERPPTDDPSKATLGDAFNNDPKQKVELERIKINGLIAEIKDILGQLNAETKKTLEIEIADVQKEIQDNADNPEVYSWAVEQLEEIKSDAEGTLNVSPEPDLTPNPEPKPKTQREKRETFKYPETELAWDMRDNAVNAVRAAGWSPEDTAEVSKRFNELVGAVAQEEDQGKRKGLLDQVSAARREINAEILKRKQIDSTYAGDPHHPVPINSADNEMVAAMRTREQAAATHFNQDGVNVPVSVQEVYNDFLWERERVKDLPDRARVIEVVSNKLQADDSPVQRIGDDPSHRSYVVKEQTEATAAGTGSFERERVEQDIKKLSDLQYEVLLKLNELKEGGNEERTKLADGLAEKFKEEYQQVIRRVGFADFDATFSAFESKWGDIAEPASANPVGAPSSPKVAPSAAPMSPDASIGHIPNVVIPPMSPIPPAPTIPRAGERPTAAPAPSTSPTPPSTPTTGAEKTPWQEVREKYKTYRTEMLAAEKAYLDSITAYEKQKKETGVVTRLFSAFSKPAEEKKQEMQAAEQKYNELLDRVRSEREERMKLFVKERLSSPDVAASDMERRYGVLHEVILDKHIDNAVALVEKARVVGDAKTESQYKAIRAIKNSYQWYRTQPLWKKIVIGTGVSASLAAGGTLVAGLGVATAGGAAAIAAQRRMIGGTFGIGSGIATKLGFDQAADTIEAKRMKKQHQEFSEKSLSQARAERLAIKRQTRNIKRAGTAAAAGVGFAVGAGASDVVSGLSHNPDAPFELDWDNFKNIDPTKTLRGYATNIQHAGSKLYDLTREAEAKTVAGGPGIGVIGKSSEVQAVASAPDSNIKATTDAAIAKMIGNEAMPSKPAASILLEGDYKHGQSIARVIDNKLKAEYPNLSDVERSRVAYRLALQHGQEQGFHAQRGNINLVKEHDHYKVKLDAAKVQAEIDRVKNVHYVEHSPIDKGNFPAQESRAVSGGGRPHSWEPHTSRGQDVGRLIDNSRIALEKQFGLHDNTRFWNVMHRENIMHLKEITDSTDPTALEQFAQAKGVSVDAVRDMVNRIDALSRSGKTPIGPLDTPESLLERAAQVRAGHFVDKAPSKTLEWVSTKPAAPTPAPAVQTAPVVPQTPTPSLEGVPEPIKSQFEYVPQGAGHVTKVYPDGSVVETNSIPTVHMTNEQITGVFARGGTVPGYHVEAMPQYGGRGTYLPNGHVRVGIIIDDKTGNEAGRILLDRRGNYGGGRRTYGYWGGNYPLNGVRGPHGQIYHEKVYHHGSVGIRAKIKF